MSIAIIGGTGPQGQGLAKRFAMAGLEVIIGSRNEDSAKKIANELSEDELDPDKLDPHFQIMVNRGKKEVISAIKNEFGKPFPDIDSTDDVMRFKKTSTAGINKVGDMLGKHSKVIDHFAPKYSKKLTNDLKELSDDLMEVDELSDNFNLP